MVGTHVFALLITVLVAVAFIVKQSRRGVHSISRLVELSCSRAFHLDTLWPGGFDPSSGSMCSGGQMHRLRLAADTLGPLNGGGNHRVSPRTPLRPQTNLPPSSSVAPQGIPATIATTRLRPSSTWWFKYSSCVRPARMRDQDLSACADKVRDKPTEKVVSAEASVSCAATNKGTSEGRIPDPP